MNQIYSFISIKWNGFTVIIKSQSDSLWNNLVKIDTEFTRTNSHRWLKMERIQHFHQLMNSEEANTLISTKMKERSVFLSWCWLGHLKLESADRHNPLVRFFSIFLVTQVPNIVTEIGSIHRYNQSRTLFFSYASTFHKRHGSAVRMALTLSQCGGHRPWKRNFIW